MPKVAFLALFLKNCYKNLQTALLITQCVLWGTAPQNTLYSLYFFTFFTYLAFISIIATMKRFILFLTLYNIIFAFSRLLLAVYDPDNMFLKSLQFNDFTFYILFPLFVIWGSLYLTIPVAIYYTVGNIISRFNGFYISTLTINSIACIAFALLILN